MTVTQQLPQSGHTGQLSRPARMAIFAVAAAAIVLAHIGLQLMVLLQYGRAPGSAYLAWHAIAAAGVVIAWLALWLRWYLLSYCLMMFLLVDIVFGVGSALLARYGLFENYLPNRIGMASPFTYHPLLQGVPKRSFSGEWMKSIRVEHNAEGIRRSTEVVPGKPTILIFGGSTTYDVGVSNGFTWVDKLELYQPAFQFLNLGVPGYSSVEHVIQTAFYFPEHLKPVCAVYYMGWNDVRSSHIPNLDPGFADFHMRSQLRSLRVVRQAHLGSPLLTFAVSALRSFLLPEMRVPQYSPDLIKPEIDERLARLFEQHARQIVLLNGPRKIKTVFLGQLMNFAALTAETAHSWTPLVPERDMKANITAFNDIMRQVASETGAGYVAVDATAFVTRDFVDNGHFNERGADKFARMVGPAIVEACRR